MSTPKTIADYLAAAGVKIAASPAPPPAPPSPPAQQKTAARGTRSASNSKVAADEGDERSKDTRKDERDDLDDRASRSEDKDSEKKEERSTGSEAKTAAQLWLEDQGIIVRDPAVAEYVAAATAKQAEYVKMSELEKLAEEERARGAIFYQGMVKESMAMQLALRQASLEQAKIAARLIGVPVESIVKRAEQLAAAVGEPALVGTDLGRAARENDSQTMAAASQNDNTTTYVPEAAQGTRAPVRGQDERTLRFIDVWTLPGNPGLNHGQRVDLGQPLG